MTDVANVVFILPTVQYIYYISTLLNQLGLFLFVHFVFVRLVFVHLIGLPWCLLCFFHMFLFPIYIGQPVGLLMLFSYGIGFS